MVHAGDPEGGIALHALEADEHVLHGGVHGMAHVELACDIGGRHDDGKGLLVRVALGMEIAVVYPEFVEPVLNVARLVGLWQFFHSLLLFDDKNRPELHNMLRICSGRCRLPWYHLNSRHGRALWLCNGSTRAAYCRFGTPAPKRPSPDLRRGFQQPPPLCSARMGYSSSSMRFHYAVMIAENRPVVKRFWADSRSFRRPYRPAASWLPRGRRQRRSDKS